MKSLNGIQAVVTGGASGVGRATVEALAAQGARVRVVSRSADKLEKVKREAKGAIEILQGDITDSAAVARSLAEITPDLLVLSAGQLPAQGPVTELTWESFSANWNNDVKSTFLFGQEVIRRPLRPGEHGGDPLQRRGAGGLAAHGRLRRRQVDAEAAGPVPPGHVGRAQAGHSLRGAGPQANDRRDGNRGPGGEDVRAKAGISQEKFMERFGKPLTAQMVAKGILTIARGEGPAGPAIAITGKSGLEAMEANLR